MRARLALRSAPQGLQGCPWPPGLPVRFAEGESEVTILMRGLGLQNGFRRRRNSHYGIATILAIGALSEVLIRNVRDMIRTKNRAHDTTKFG